VTDAPSAVSRGGASLVWMALLPVVLLVALVALVIWSGPADAVRGAGYPPIERLAFQRVMLGPEGIVLTVLNDGPDPVTVAQVSVDEAYWSFEARPSRVLSHLGRATITVPYPWVHGETHQVRLMTSTGLTFDHEIGVAVATPRPSARFLATFTLIGLYVGVLPVAIGLLWFPLVSRIGRTSLDFLLALTVGLLAFLFVDASHEGLNAAATAPASYQGMALFVFGALGAYLGLEAVGGWLRARGAAAGRSEAFVLAQLVAAGIGLHNFAEGLAISAAFSLGEAALGTLLIVGFALHNTTEGLAIVAPLGKAPVRLRDLATLGLVGGVPTIAGAWVGGFVYSPALAVLFLAVGAGAIAQVVVQITRQMAGGRPLAAHVATPAVLGGLFAGFLVMYATGMLIG